MNNIFDNININLPQLHYFQQLEPIEKIHYLFEIYENALYSENYTSANFAEGLNEFFDELDYDNEPFPEFESFDVGNGRDSNRVEVLVDSENIVIESNSLRAVRSIRDKFLDCGYLLTRDQEVEKLFRRDKLTRYLRVFKIIGKTFHLCCN
jgi:hypothetical protein|tara:strand:+ start:61 stop:513 length:453 start_codon:yes stop_codon:yes gene_type:complete